MNIPARAKTWGGPILLFVLAAIIQGPVAFFLGVAGGAWVGMNLSHVDLSNLLGKGDTEE